MQSLTDFFKKSFYYALNTHIILTKFFQLQSVKYVFTSFWVKILLNFKKLNVYYLRNEHLWLDGFLFDFLQKKTADI